MNRLFKTSQFTVVPPIFSYSGIPPTSYCPPCTVTPVGGPPGGPGAAPGTGGSGNPGSSSGGTKQTCYNVPIGSTCVNQSTGQIISTGPGCQIIYAQLCQ